MKAKSAILGAALFASILGASTASAENGLYAGGSLGLSASGFNFVADGFTEYFMENPATYRREDGWANFGALGMHKSLSAFAGYRRDLKTLENGMTLFGRVEGGLSLGSSSVSEDSLLGSNPYTVNVQRGNSAYGAIHMGAEKNGWRVYGLGGLSVAEQSVSVAYKTGEGSLMEFAGGAGPILEKSATVPFADIGLGVERDVNERMAVRLEVKQSIDLNESSQELKAGEPYLYNSQYDVGGSFTSTAVSVGVTFKF